MKKHLYYEIWRRSLSDMTDLLEAFPAYSMIQLSSSDFQEAGNRQDYSFRLELNDLQIINNIEGSAVARDLGDAIKGNVQACEFFRGKHVIISMDENFSLRIKQQ